MTELEFERAKRAHEQMTRATTWERVTSWVKGIFAAKKTPPTAHPQHPGFYAVRIPLSEFLNPPAEREGERMIDSEGRVMNFLQLPEEEVTVLRRMP